MGISLVLALLINPSIHAVAKIGANQEYEEPAFVQKIPGYHPLLRFLPGSTFVFQTKYMIADGHYSLQGSHYEFRPETAELLNHADIDKIAETMPPEQGRGLVQTYNLSLKPFDADYSASDGSLSLHYSPDGKGGMYQLYDYTAGDGQALSLVSDIAKPLVGLWGQTDPNPEKLDSKTRFRVGGIDGLTQFSGEAAASESAEFMLIDLRSDGTFRFHDKVGRWERDGAVVKLTAEKFDLTLQISRDLSKLFTGKTVFKR